MSPLYNPSNSHSKCTTSPLSLSLSQAILGPCGILRYLIMDQLSNNKRVRDDSDESEFDSPEVKRLREDLLGNLDDPDLWATCPDLDSFMKSFYEEISPPPVDLTSRSGECPAGFGFLLEASDDELGLPPRDTREEDRKNHAELERVTSNSSGELSESWRLDDQFPSYDSFEFGLGVNLDGNNEGEFVGLDGGVFDYSDLDFGLYDAGAVVQARNFCQS
ncbi:uncharacterized protein LOC131310784 [Rhododendron vialii]|uniref:uncharacterized protein LOC131310784 n=1 Tax=Rhododendron vialii TaxID=182163 RepID=UPI00265EB62C|nr:uncharacterized protein LOC131310784 [Rhododendron vialii]